LQRLSLDFVSGHLFVTIEGERWLVDTGSPNSFGRETTLGLDDQSFRVAGSDFGLDSAALSSLVGEPLAGLIGGDILGKLDIELDVSGGNLTASLHPLALVGTQIALEDFMGVPLLHAESEEGAHLMLFDTGAPISYFQHDSLERYEAAGELRDFFPGVGEFTTSTHKVPFTVGQLPFKFRCGRLPELLGLTLAMAGAEGIVGNELCLGRKVGYFPRRGLLVLA